MHNKEKSSGYTTPVKKNQRGRACSESMPIRSFFFDSAVAGDADAGNESDKSLSTNENTLPLTASSSALNSANAGVHSPPSGKVARGGSSRIYESSKTDVPVTDIDALKSALATA